MSARTKVLFIGLDSSEPDLIKQWMDEGVLPTLRSLRQGGAWSDISNQPGFGHSSAWASVATGADPGSHGHYFLAHFRPDTYQATPFEDDDFRVQPLWSPLSEAGKRVAVIDMDWSPLCRDLNGFQLVDWATHAPRSPQPVSWPPELAGQVVERFGRDPMRQWRRDGPDPAATHKALRDMLVDRVAQKTELSCHFLEQGGWDLFMTSFGEPHDVGHDQWHLHDPSHPLHDPDWRRKYGDPVKDIYAALDTAVARLLDCAGPEATAFVFAGPGMEPNFTGNHMLDEILRRLETGTVTSGGSFRDNLKKVYRGLVPEAVRDRLMGVAGRMNESMLASDRRNRKAFALPNNDNSGAIRINLVGREANGLVQPGAEYEACCAELTQDLLEIVNLETGKPVVDRVVRVADHCHGEHVDELPDLFVAWRRDGMIEKVRSPKLGELHLPYPGWRTGDHTRNCLLFARGPAVEPGHLGTPPTAMDLAPTMAALLDESLPGADGTPIVPFGGGA